MVTNYCTVICSKNGTPGNAKFTYAFSPCQAMSCYSGKPDTAAVSCMHVSFSPFVLPPIHKCCNSYCYVLHSPISSSSGPAALHTSGTSLALCTIWEAKKATNVLTSTVLFSNFFFLPSQGPPQLLHTECIADNHHCYVICTAVQPDLLPTGPYTQVPLYHKATLYI